VSKELDDYTIDELLAIIKGLQSRKKFGLVWEDKAELVELMCAENLPVLFEAEDKAILHEAKANTNLIIEGDNFHSLSVLNYTHVGQVDVIYIDPPYNTGSKDFIYNDTYVDKDDTYRHSKWLSFMEKRLRLAKNLLKPSGAIFISIDQNELANLKLLCDEVLTGLTMSGLVSVAKGTTTGQDAKKFGSSIDYLLVYVGQDFQLQLLPLTEDDQKRFSLEDTQSFNGERLEKMTAEKTDQISIMLLLPQMEAKSSPSGRQDTIPAGVVQNQPLKNSNHKTWWSGSKTMMVIDLM